MGAVKPSLSAVHLPDCIASRLEVLRLEFLRDTRLAAVISVAPEFCKIDVLRSPHLHENCGGCQARVGQVFARICLTLLRVANSETTVHHLMCDQTQALFNLSYYSSSFALCRAMQRCCGVAASRVATSAPSAIAQPCSNCSPSVILANRSSHDARPHTSKGKIYSLKRRPVLRHCRESWLKVRCTELHGTYRMLSSIHGQLVQLFLDCAM